MTKQYPTSSNNNMTTTTAFPSGAHQSNKTISMKKLFLPLLVAFVFMAGIAEANAQATIADWTFETTAPTTSGPLSPEVGAGSASGHHTGAATYSSPSGNASTHSYSANTWAVGDYFQFQVASTGYTAIKLGFDATGSATGPSSFKVQYSIDGTSFTDFQTYAIPTAVANTAISWSATGSPNATSTLSFNLSSITALNNLSAIYFRLVCNGTGTINGGTLSGTGGTSRVDNVIVTGTPADPTTTSLSPTSVNAGSGAFTLTVNGTNFMSGLSTVTWGGSTRTTTFVSSTQLTAAILAADVASAGTATVGVTTTGAVNASNTQTFTINTVASNPPTLSTTAATSISNTGATLAGNISSAGTASVTADGIVYSVTGTNNNPQISGTGVTNSAATTVQSGAFSVSPSSLSPQTNYSFNAYATNSVGTSYGTVATFYTYSSPPTAQPATFTTTPASSSLTVNWGAATFPGSGATAAGYLVIYAASGTTPALSSTNGTAPAASAGTLINITSGSLSPAVTTTISSLTNSTTYNLLLIPYTWDGTNAATYNYLTASAETTTGTPVAATLLLTEDFNYAAGTVLNINDGVATHTGSAYLNATTGWYSTSAPTTSPITCTSTGTGLSYLGSPSSNVGYAASMLNTGDDEIKPFTAQTSGSVYNSFLVNVSAAQTGDYFYTMNTGTAYTVRLYIKANSTGFSFGLGKSSATATYESTVRTFGTTYLVVSKYLFNTVSNSDDVVSLFVNPTLGQTSEPAATIAALGSGTADGAQIDGLTLRQGGASSASTQFIDGIRVGTTWASVTPSTPTLTLVGSPITATSYTVGSGPAASGNSFTVQGDYLTNASGTITITAPADFEVSTSATTGFGSTATFNFTSNTLAQSTAYVRLKAGLAQATYSNETINVSDGTTSGTLTVSGTVAAPSPALTAVTLSAAMANIFGTASNGVSFVATGANLTGATLTVTPVSGWEVSTTSATAGFQGSGTAIAGLTAGATVYIRNTATLAAASYNATVVANITGGGAASGAAVTTSASGNTVTPITPYYWNGAVASGSGLTAVGGSGTWNGSLVNWINGNPGTAVAWPAAASATSYQAIFGGTAGNVIIGATGTAQTTYQADIQTTGYTFMPAASTAYDEIAGPVKLESGVNLYVFNPSSTVATPSYTAGQYLEMTSNLTGASSSSLTMQGSPQAASGVANPSTLIEFVGINSTVSVPTINVSAGTLTGSNVPGAIGLEAYLTAGTSSSINAMTLSSNIVNNNISGTSGFPFFIGANNAYTRFDVTGNISGTGDLQISSAYSSGYGTTRLSGNNTYAGLTIIGGNGSSTSTATNMTLQLGSSTALPATTSVVFGNPNSFYTIAGNLDMNGFNTSIVDLYTNASKITSTVTVTPSAVVNSSATASTITLTNPSSSHSMTLPINNGTGTVALSITGGTFTLTKASTFSGGLSVSGGGTFQAGIANVIPSTETITLNGGTYSTGATTGYSVTVNTLTLSGNSTLALGTGSHNFTVSSLLSLGSNTLTITGWTGSIGVSGTAGQVIFPTGLTSGQLSKIAFAGFPGGAVQLGTGEVVPTSSTATLAAYSTQLSGNVLRAASNVPLAGFKVTTPSGTPTSFTQVIVTGTGVTNGTDVTNVAIYSDLNGNGIIDGSDAIVSDVTSSFATTMTFNISGQNITGTTSYLIVAQSVDPSPAASSVGVAIASAAFTTNDNSSVGSLSTVTRNFGYQTTPVISSITPTSTTAGNGGTLQVFSTTNTFINGLSAITYNGSPVTTTFVSAGELDYTIPTNILSGTATIGVTTSGAASTSNTKSLSIAAPPYPQLVITANTSSAFGNICQNATSSLTFTVTNSGTVDAANVTVATNNGVFALSTTSLGTITANGGTKTYTVNFTPTATGAQTATITVTSTTTSSNTATSNLTGTGLGTATPTVASSAPTNVVNATATLNGSISTSGASANLGTCPLISDAGFVLSSTQSTVGTLIVGGSGVTKISKGIQTGSYTYNATGLAGATQYYYNAYVVYGGVTYYGSSVQTFTTFTATQLVFGSAPTAGLQSTSLSSFTVSAVNSDGSTVDTKFTGPVTVAATLGSDASPMGGTLTVNAVAGVATFSAANFTGTGGNNTITASATLSAGSTVTEVSSNISIACVSPKITSLGGDFLTDIQTSGGTTNFAITGLTSANAISYNYYPSSTTNPGFAGGSGGASTVGKLSIIAGNSFTVKLTNGNNYSLEAGVYIDYDNDGTFSSSNLVADFVAAAAVSGTPTTTTSPTLTVPSNFAAGNFRMRIVYIEGTSGNTTFSSLSGCNTGTAIGTYGFTQDFDVTLSAANYYWTPTSAGTWDNSSVNWSDEKSNPTTWPATSASATTANFNSSSFTNVTIPGTIVVAPSNIDFGNNYTFTVTGNSTFSSAIALGANTLTLAPSTGVITTISGVVSGTGSITQNGAGTTVISATNTYSGNTTVSAGTLTVNGVIKSTTTTTVSSGATLSGTGSVGTAIFNTGSTVSPAGSGTVGTLTTGAITIAGGTTYTADIASSGTTATVDLLSTGVVTNNATSGSKLTINLSGALTSSFDNTTGYTWTLFSFSSSTTAFSASNTVLNTAGIVTTNLGNGAFSLLFTSTSVKLVFTPTATAPTSVSTVIGDKQITVSFGLPANSVYSGTPTSYTVTANPGNITKTGASSPITVTGLTNNTTYTFTVTATTSLGTGAASVGVTGTPSSTTIWSGTSWSAGVPANDPLQAVIIAGNLVNSSLITPLTTCSNLTVNSGVTFTNAATITLSGSSLTNNGTITGGTIVLAGTSGAQTIAGTGLLSGLTINNTAGASVTGTLGITGVLTLKSGQLSTGGNLTFKSTSITNTGTLAAIDGVINTGSISGNVTVERYIPKGFRGYRDLSPEVYGAGTIKKNWQENGFTPSGYGIFITGPTAYPGSANAGLIDGNGFDETGSTAGNTQDYTYVNGVWTPFANTTSTNLDPFKGYRLLVRGDRTSNLYTTPVTNTQSGLAMFNATTLRATGQLITGTVTYSKTNVISTVATDNTVTLNNNVGGFSLVANPYVCPVLWGTGSGTQSATTSVYGASANINGSYWYLDPTYSATGRYLAFNALTGSSVVRTTTNGDTTYNSTASLGYIQPGQAVFVQTFAASPTVVFKETAKAASSTKGAIFGTASLSKIYVSLLKQATGATTYDRVDGAAVAFRSDFGNKVYGPQDALKLSGATDNLFISDKGKNLSIDGRLPATASDAVSLAISKPSGKSYQLQVDASAYASNGFAPVLYDAYKNTTTKLGTGVSNVDFTIDTAVSSSYSNRFTILFTPSALPVNSIVASASLNNKVATITWNTVGEKGVARYEVEKSTDAKTFATIGQSTAKNTATASYSTTDNSVTATSYYRIKAVSTTGNVSYSNIAKLSIINYQLSISLYPNPLKGKTLNVALDNVVAGKYTVSIYNALGQKVNEQTISHTGGSATHAISINNALAAGVYNVAISEAGSKQLVHQSTLSVQP